MTPRGYPDAVNETDPADRGPDPVELLLGQAPRVPGARAVRVTLVVMACAVLGLGVLGLALVAISGETLSPWPGLTMVLLGQLAALPALAAAALGLHRSHTGRDPGAARVRTVLRRTPVPLLVALVAAFGLWAWWEPDMWLPTLGCALVAVQVGLLARLLSR